MSWLKENYDKAALGGAAIIALGAGALILSSDAGEVTEGQNPIRVNTFDVPEQKELDINVKALDKTGAVTGQKHLESDLYSFIAFPIYGVKGSDDIGELSPDRPFHGIPLKWWKEHKLDDYKFEGGGEEDNDKDGFTNKEEFEGKTNPNELSSRPELTKKLQLLDSKKTSYRMQWSRVDDNRANFTFTLRRTSFDILGVGGTFPTKGQPEDFLNRFKVKSKGTGKNPTTSSQEEYYEIEDTQKSGLTHTMWRSDGPRRFLDWATKLKLDTPDGGDAFVVPEGGEFSLPFKKGGKGYTFKFDPKRDSSLKNLNNIEIVGPNGVVPLGLAPPPEEISGEDDLIIE